jgi:hypothetical protein
MVPGRLTVVELPVAALGVTALSTTPMNFTGNTSSLQETIWAGGMDSLPQRH